MDNCIFCKIIKGEIPAYKIWEDAQYIAILDIFPSSKGMTLVIPKEHQPSYIKDLDTQSWTDMLKALKAVAEILDTKLPNIIRTKFVFEGLDVPHLHAKLIPEYPETLKNQPQPQKASDAELAEVKRLLDLV